MGTDSERTALRFRRDAWLLRFVIMQILIGLSVLLIGLAIRYESTPAALTGMLMCVLLVGYAAYAWLKALASHWRLRRLNSGSTRDVE
ncbi:MAG: hypothetical protein IT473_10215 [Lysobacter sp.]|nr:hypothetical protein [Lysobacter sp.]